jgi:TonB family protein
MNTRALITAATIFVSQPSAFVLAQASSAYIESGGGTAVDTRGQRYFGKDYPEKLMPWMVDRVYSISPDYPYGDRAQRHEGTGYFRLSLAPKTGTVTQVRVVRSTGFASLDACATTALRRWRWRPGKWKEIETSVTFRLSRSEPGLPKGSVPIPVR